RRPTHKWMALAITSIGTFFAGLTVASLNLAAPILASDFSITMDQVQWLLTVYLIAVCSTMLLLGRIGDRIGSHRIYIAGLVVFVVGSALCGFCDSFLPLLACRFVQGLGSAMMMATGMALIATIFPPQQRGMAIGISVLVVGLGNASGPAIGGLVLAFFSWQTIFFLNIPFIIIALALAIPLLRSPVPPQKTEHRLDTRGAILLFVLLTLLITGISGGFANSQWFLIPGVIMIPLFILFERRQPSALLDFGLLKNRRFALGNLITFFSYTSSMIITFQLPFFLEDVWAMPVENAGLLLMVSALCMGISAPLAGVISDRVGAMRVMPVALVVMICGQVLALFLTLTPTFALFIPIMILTGTGMGLINTPNNSEIMAAAGHRLSGYASGFVGTNRNLAFTLATSISAGLFVVLVGLYAHGAEAPPLSTHVLALRSVIGLAILLAVVSLIICLYLAHLQGKDKSPEGGEEQGHGPAPDDRPAHSPADAHADAAAGASLNALLNAPANPALGQPESPR
ncbi:MAG: MFS transporter, partial [Coriobacteriia bacterium]|nr:MFS transporter [Coriobacteriia bacterium]